MTQCPFANHLAFQHGRLLPIVPCTYASDGHTELQTQLLQKNVPQFFDRDDTCPNSKVELPFVKKNGPQMVPKSWVVTSQAEFSEGLMSLMSKSP